MDPQPGALALPPGRELVRNADSQALPQAHQTRNSEDEPRNLCFITTPAGDSDTGQSLRPIALDNFQIAS